MSVSAATHSQVLATAPAPRRLHYGEESAYQQKLKAISRRAIELLEPAGGVYASREKKTEIRNILKAEFGLDEYRAGSFIVGAEVRITDKNYGVANAHLKSQPYQFSSQQEAKTLAREKMGQLEYGVQLFNLSIKSWSPEKMREMWTKQWQGSFEHRMLANGGDEAEAIAFADKGLKGTIERNGAVGGDNYQLRLGLGGLEAGFGALPVGLITENADGTLTINRDTLKGTPLGDILNIGSHLGQQVDQAA